MMAGLTDAEAGRATLGWYLATLLGGAESGRSQVGGFACGGEAPRRD